MSLEDQEAVEAVRMLQEFVQDWIRDLKKKCAAEMKLNQTLLFINFKYQISIVHTLNVYQNTQKGSLLIVQL